MYASWRQVKQMLPKDIKVGDVIEAYRQNGTHHSTSDGWLVIDKAGAFIVIQTRRGQPTQESLSTEDLILEVPLTEKEYHKKYQKGAQEIINALCGDPLPLLGWDSHTMDNSWTACDAWDMAASCEDKHIKVLGWFPLESVKHGWFHEYDIGIVAQDLDDNDIFWTHYNSAWIQEMREWFESLTMEEGSE